MKSKHAALWLGVALLAVFAMAASSPQCARSTDPTSPDHSLNPLAQDPCKADCLDTFKQAKRDEQARFKAAQAACNGNIECRMQEEIIHQMIVDELVADKDACLVDCDHQQGIGAGGQ